MIPARLIKKDERLPQNDVGAPQTCDKLPADRERLFWLGIRQALLILLVTIEKFKVTVKSERCEGCGKGL